MRWQHAGLLVLVLFLSGCEEGDPVTSDATQQPAPVVSTPAQPANAQTPERTVAKNTTIVEGSADKPDAGMVREKAERGMGKKGQRYGGGIITQPISTYFRTRDRIDFEIKIPSGMNTFKALNDRYPKDLEEFMQEIIKPAGIQLPELPLGHRYVYDPEKGELLVERPQ